MNTMERRLLVIAILAAGSWALIVGFEGLVSGPLKKINLDLDKVDTDIKKANTTLNSQAIVDKNWNRVRDRLDLPRIPDAHTHFLTHLGEVFEKVGVSFDVSENPQPVQQGDFKEYIFDTKFKLTWAQYVELLVELHKSTEFLKPLRMTVASQYEKEDRLDVDLKISTIEYSPAPVKAGAK